MQENEILYGEQSAVGIGGLRLSIRIDKTAERPIAEILAG